MIPTRFGKNLVGIFENHDKKKIPKRFKKTLQDKKQNEK